MIKQIKILKEVSLEKERLLQSALSLDIKINKLEKDLHNAKLKLSTVANKIEQVNNRAFKLIKEL